METVLGLSVTSSSVGWVVIDGPGVDAAALDHDVSVVAGAAADDISKHLRAVRGAQAIAAASGHDVSSIGLTWTDDAATTAKLVLRALPGLGFDKVVPVRLAEAGEEGGDDIALVLACGAALAVASNAATIPVPLVRREPVAVAQTPKHPWVAPTRAAAVLVAGLSVLFALGPELAGQPGPPAPQTPAASDSPAAFVSVRAVPAPAPPPVADAVQLVVGRPAPRPTQSTPVQEIAPMTAYVAEEAAPPVAEVTTPEVEVPEAPVTAEPAGVPHMPGQLVAAPLPGAEPAPAPVAPPPVDPAQAVFSPLFSALP